MKRAEPKVGDPVQVLHVVRWKGICDGARTVGDVVARLEKALERARRWQAEGWSLAHPVAEDYADLTHPEHVAKLGPKDVVLARQGVVPDCAFANCPVCFPKQTSRKVRKP